MLHIPYSLFSLARSMMINDAAYKPTVSTAGCSRIVVNVMIDGDLIHILCSSECLKEAYTAVFLVRVCLSCLWQDILMVTEKRSNITGSLSVFSYCQLCFRRRLPPLCDFLCGRGGQLKLKETNKIKYLIKYLLQPVF